MADRSRYYVYDGSQQLCKTIEPETGATIMGYDAAGNLAWSAAGVNHLATTTCNLTEGWNSGRRVERAYDARSRLMTLLFPDGRGNQQWHYTPDGLPSSVVTYNEPGGTMPVENTYSYNRRRLMIGETSAQSWYTWPIGYGYDKNGFLASQVSPTYLTLTFSPNGLGQPTLVQDSWGTVYASGISYYPNGAVAQFTYGNGITHTMQQNDRQLPAQSTDNWGAADYIYEYDENGNPTLITDSARGSNYSRWLVYDGLDRLTDAGSCSFGGDCWHHFDYDAIDNLRMWKLAGVKDYANYYYDTTNRLISIQNSSGGSTVGFGYDVQGNLQNKNGQGYDFDHGNRLRTVYNKEFYRYDGYGRRVMSWRQPGFTNLSMYSSSGQLVYQSDESKSKSFDYIHLAGSLIATIEYQHPDWTSTVKFQHTDALGSPVAVTNSAGVVLERTAWEPYGAAINKPTYDGVGYTGHVMDGVTGLTYMQQRYYDPMIGRFLSVDPVSATSVGGNFNRYWYANNNPYRFTDPDGRQSASSFCPAWSPCGSGSFGSDMQSITQSTQSRQQAPSWKNAYGAANGKSPTSTSKAQPAAQSAYEPPSVLGFLKERTYHEWQVEGAFGPGGKVGAKNNLAGTDPSAGLNYAIGEGWFIGTGLAFKVYSSGQQRSGFNGAGSLSGRLGALGYLGFDLTTDMNGNVDFYVSFGFGLGEGVLYHPPGAGLQTNGP